MPTESVDSVHWTVRRKLKITSSIEDGRFNSWEPMDEVICQATPLLLAHEKKADEVSWQETKKF